MNRITLLVFAVFFTFSVTGFAGDFFLVDKETGEKLGPFHYTNHGEIRVDDKAYTVHKVDKAQIVKDKMRSIIIQELNFRQANIVDIIHFLVETSRQQDPKNIGVSIILNLQSNHNVMQSNDDSQIAPQDLQHFDDPFADFPVEASKGKSNEPSTRLITMDLRRVSLYDALVLVCESANLNFKVGESAVEIFPKKSVPKVPDSQADPPPKSKPVGEKE